MNRRRTLMLAAAGAPLLTPLAAAASSPMPKRIKMPSAAAFSALVGQRLRVDGRSYRLKAVRTAPSLQARIEQFSLVLAGAAALPSGLYAVHHPAVGELQLQLSASGERQLRADISRLA